MKYTAEEVRARFEAWLIREHEYAPEDLIWQEKRNCYADYATHLAWNAYRDAYADLLERIERAQSCEKCKGRGEVFNDVHVRMMTCPHCHGARKVASAEPAAQTAQVDESRYTAIGRAFCEVLADPSMAWRDTGAKTFIDRVRQTTSRIESTPTVEPTAQGESCKICGKDTPHHHLRGTVSTSAQPAQSVDVAKVREVIAHLRSFRSNTPPTWAHLDDAADKLEAALPESKP